MPAPCVSARIWAQCVSGRVLYRSLGRFRCCKVVIPLRVPARVPIRVLGLLGVSCRVSGFQAFWSLGFKVSGCKVWGEVLTERGLESSVILFWSIVCPR